MTRTKAPTIRELAEGVWVVDHPFAMPGGIEIGTRTTVTALEEGGLWLHSPGPSHPEVDAFLQSHGPVRDVVAPNLMHHLYLAACARAWPDARVHGPSGLEAKVGGALKWMPLREASFAGEVDALHVEGCPKLEEWVFLHRASRTLVLTDIAFNIRQANGLLTRVFMRLNGALGRFGPTRLGRRVFFEDHGALGTSVRRILDWDFDRVIVAHGEVLETGGREALREAFGWLLA